MLLFSIWKIQILGEMKIKKLVNLKIYFRKKNTYSQSNYMTHIIYLNNSNKTCKQLNKIDTVYVQLTPVNSNTG